MYNSIKNSYVIETYNDDFANKFIIDNTFDLNKGVYSQLESTKELTSRDLIIIWKRIATEIKNDWRNFLYDEEINNKVKTSQHILKVQDIMNKVITEYEEKYPNLYFDCVVINSGGEMIVNSNTKQNYPKNFIGYGTIFNGDSLLTSRPHIIDWGYTTDIFAAGLSKSNYISPSFSYALIIFVGRKFKSTSVEELKKRKYI